MVSFTQAVKNSLTYCKHFDFKGRSCRSEFWWASLGICLIEVAITLLLCLIFVLFKPLSEEAALIFVGLDLLVASILGAYANILISIRRLHDRNMRGWWYLLFFVPYVGWAALIVLFCLKGTTGPNRFGPDPLVEMQPIDTNPYPRQPNLGNPNCQPVPKQYVAPAKSMDQPIQQDQQFGAPPHPSKGKKKSLLPQLLLVFGGLLASVLVVFVLTDISDEGYVRRTRIGCVLQDSHDCEYLGLMYKHGDRSVTQDYAKAAEYFAKGCKLQNGSACEALGNLYFEGKGVPQDSAKAAKYYSKGCELNFSPACLSSLINIYHVEGSLSLYAADVGELKMILFQLQNQQMRTGH